MTVAHNETRQPRTSGRNDEVMVARHKQTFFFVVMDPLENVFVGEVLILHCHENGDCQESYDRHSERSRVGSELLQSADDFQPERSRVSFELHCCQEEDAQVVP